MAAANAIPAVSCSGLWCPTFSMMRSAWAIMNGDGSDVIVFFS